MRQSDLQRWIIVQRRANNYSRDVRDAILRALDNIERELTPAQLHQFIASGSLDRVFSDAALEQELLGPVTSVRDVLRNSFDYYAKQLPNGGRLPGGGPAVAFDVLDPNVVAAIKTLDTRVFSVLRKDVREVVRKVISDGLKEGKNPVAMARDLRDVLGMSPTQYDAVKNFERMLEAGDREALTRLLRDKRFDSLLERSLGRSATNQLTKDQIERMVGAYERRMVAFNAETNARTAALDALKMGQRLSWVDAVDNGFVNGDTLMKRWVGVKDDRERPEHLAMEGETVPFDEPFSNGEMVPGDSTYNCRCIAIYFQQRQ